MICIYYCYLHNTVNICLNNLNIRQKIKPQCYEKINLLLLLSFTISIL